MKEVEVRAILRIHDGVLRQVSLLSETPQGMEALDGLFHGRVKGLPYCQQTTIKPVAAGGDGKGNVEYLLNLEQSKTR